MRPLVVGTRGSALALAQAKSVKEKLEQFFPKQPFTLEVISAQADQRPDAPFSAFRGEGIFVKELEIALQEGRIDVAVHSLKDVPLAQPAGLTLAAIVSRDDYRDAIVSRGDIPLEKLPSGVKIGTSSLRRKSQLLAHRNDVVVEDIRGNVDTRLRKLDEGQYDAILLAACGLMRLKLADRITDFCDPEWMLPEPGQGALAVETRADDAETNATVGRLDDDMSRLCVSAERAFLEGLGGGCRVPIAALASLWGDRMRVDGAVIAPDGSRRLRDQITGPLDDARRLGRDLAARLARQGAGAILAEAGG